MKTDTPDAVRPSSAVTDWLSGPPLMVIGGQRVQALSGNTFDVIDPATGTPLVTLPRAAEADVDVAVAAARKAFDAGKWSRVRPGKRTEILFAVSELIRKNIVELAEIESLDTGKPIRMASGEVWLASDIFRYYAGWPTKIFGETIASNDDLFVYTLREPIGVCAAITPWNVPILNAAFKIAPALACGNSLVIKPSENAPLSTVRLVELCIEAGVPDGVLSVLTGYGSEAGAPLAAHRDIDKISFTGSTAVGRQITSASIGNLKRVSLELGGKGPSIILPGANLDRAVAGIFDGAFLNSGQMCTAGSRIIVDHSLVDQLVSALENRSKKTKLGPGLDPSTTMGPLISAKQRDQVAAYVELGQQEGARLAFGGQVRDDLGGGFFIEPGILVDGRNDMRVAREEIFGPIGVIVSVDTIEEAITTANDTDYGLAAILWTEDISIAQRTARRMKAGTIWINSYGLLDAAVPLGGYKQSGIGRELGLQSISEYTEVKSVWSALAPMDESASLSDRVRDSDPTPS